MTEKGREAGTGLVAEGGRRPGARGAGWPRSRHRALGHHLLVARGTTPLALMEVKQRLCAERRPDRLRPGRARCFHRPLLSFEREFLLGESCPASYGWETEVQGGE